MHRTRLRLAPSQTICRYALALVALTIFFTLLVSGRSGCNPLATGPPRTAPSSSAHRSSRAQSAPTDALRFDPDLVTHYAPDENLEHLDTDLLNTATHTLDIAAYSLTDFAFRDALIAAAGRGVTVRIYLDKVQAAGEQKRDDDNTDTAVLSALAQTPGITVRIKHSAVLMHLKSYAVDNTTLRSGSANFSPTGEKRQDNDLSLTQNAVAVAAFEQHFNEMWARPDNDPLR